MRKRIVTSFALSIVLPLAAFVAVAMRIGGAYRWRLAVALYAGGWLCLLLAVRKHRRTRVTFRRRGRRAIAGLRENWRFLVVALLALLLAYVAWVVFPVEATEFLTADPAEVQQRIEADIGMVPVYIRGLEKTLAQIEQDGSIRHPEPHRLTPQQRQTLLELWSRYLAYAMELEKAKHVHKHFYQISYRRYPEWNLRSFLIAYSAFIANFENSIRLAALPRNLWMRTFLNEHRPDLDIPPRSLLALQEATARPDALVQLHLGQANLQLLKAVGKLSDADDHALIAYAETSYTDILKQIGQRPDILARAPRHGLEQIVFETWLPLQKGVAEGMSLIRTTHRPNFITQDDIRSIMPELEPGDILLERRNWYLTNIGIPGFWPHTALYTGTLAELDRYFEGIPVPGAASVSDYLRAQLPDLFALLSGQSPDGYAFRVFEALGPGVIPTPLEISAAADYLAVLRPRLDKQDKLKAILRAFSFHGRPYDYNFDFITDDALVCSELIYKAYEPGEAGAGLTFQLEETAGRPLLPPHSMVRKFAREYGTENAELEFVLFLDGSENEKKAIRRDASAFSDSCRRSKWDVAQE